MAANMATEEKALGTDGLTDEERAEFLARFREVKGSTEPWTARETLERASRWARADSFGGGNQFMDALADWWAGEAQAHFHDGGSEKYIYDMPGMSETPAVRAALAYFRGDR